MENYFMKKLITLLTVLLFAMALISCSKVGTSPQGEETPIEKAAIKLVSDVKDGGYKLIGADELYRWMEEKKDFVLIDAHPKADYEKAHIKGAVNSPFPKTDKEVTPAEKANVVKVAGTDKNKPVVIYCGFTACRRSHFGAAALIENGYKNVYRYPGGITGWKEYKYPTN
jgi:rhodanese-related sulfurtransferase